MDESEIEEVEINHFCTDEPVCPHCGFVHSGWNRDMYALHECPRCHGWFDVYHEGPDYVSTTAWKPCPVCNRMNQEVTPGKIGWHRDPKSQNTCVGFLRWAARGTK